MSKTKLQPLGYNVVIEPEKTEEKTESGIILPETTDKEQPQIGKVIALGSKIKPASPSGGKSDSSRLREPKQELKVNDKVLFEKYGMEEVKIGESEYLIGPKNKILAIIK